VPVERPRVRINDRIRSPQVRLLDVDGQSLGVIPVAQALALARNAGLDLVEIAPQATPPVCRIISYSKWCYQRDKHERQNRQRPVETKEVRFGVRIGDSDLKVKCRKATEMLAEGHRVRCTVQLKGREHTHPELADAVLTQVLAEIGPNGVLDGAIRREPRRISCVLRPA
jgi:translation initiation factor IF-3